jgi:hypothetical protein
MRRSVTAIAAAVGLGLFTLPVVSAPTTTFNSSSEFERSVELAQMGGGYCARLRRACEFKGERGEVGEGNCRRYRRECGGRASYCERLRRACFNKEERGESGMGNCRRYRAECGGR